MAADKECNDGGMREMRMRKKVGASAGDSLRGLALRLEESLCATERLLGVSLTIIDAHGHFSGGPGGGGLFSQTRRSHKKNACCAAGFCQRCILHCRHEVGEMARGETRAWFVHTCWKGAAELVLPLRLDGAYAGHLFAGIWRAPPAQDASSAIRITQPNRITCTLDALTPLPARQRLEELGALLAVYVEGFQHILLKGLRTGGEGINARIERFLERNYHRCVTLDDLGRELGVSPSRASHLATECGESFQQRLLRQRIRAARVLLADGELRINEVARAVGFPDPYYFSRMFRRETGRSPRAYRCGHNADAAVLD